MSLNTFNAYGGGNTLNSGTLMLGHANALGTGPLTLNGGNLDSSVADLLSANNPVQAWNGVSNYSGTPTPGTNSGTLEIGGAGSLGSGDYAQAIAIGSGSTLKFTSSTAQTLAGVIAGALGGAKDTNAIGKLQTIAISGGDLVFSFKNHGCLEKVRVQREKSYSRR